MGLDISDAVRKKLAVRHGVSEDEVIECFSNREGDFLRDTREEHRTDPPTLWFVAETYRGRKLKVVFMYYPNDKRFVIKTTYDANQKEIDIYDKHAK